MDKRIFGLDVVRALAISLVFSIHLITNTISGKIGVFWYLAYLGVDIFFALSGFLIGGILIEMCNKQTEILTLSQSFLFLIRRWFRTVPLYLIVLLGNFIIGKYILKNVDSLSWKYFFWVQSFSNFPPSFFGESWSLCIEEWFYFTFATGLSLFTMFSYKWRTTLSTKIFWFTVFYIILITALRIIFSKYDYKEFNITIFRLDAIVYGVLAALVNKFYKPTLTKSYWIGIGGIILSALGILLFLSRAKIGNYYILYYNISGLGFAITVFYFKLMNDWFKKNLQGKIITFISNISYSVYLLNLLVISIMSDLFKYHSENYFLLILSLSGTILLSYFTYKFIETPFLSFRNKYLK